MPRFFDRKWLTPYAMACGYLHSQKDGDARLCELSSGVYEIELSKRTFKEWPAYGDKNGENCNCFFITFRDIHEARKAFKSICGELNQRTEIINGVARSVYK